MTSRTRVLARAALLLLAAATAVPAFAQSAIDESRPLASGGRVEVDNVAGLIRVRGWDRDAVSVTGDLGGAERLDIDASANRVRIKAVYPNGRGHRDGARLELRVPAGSELEASAVSAEVDIAEVDLRRLEVDTVSGGVEARGRAAEARIEGVSGGVEAELVTRRLGVETVSGPITVGGEIDGVVEAEAVSGPVTLTLGTIQELRGETVSGPLSVRAAGLAPGGGVSLETVSGRIDLHLPRSTSARLRLSSFSGGIESPVGEVRRPKYGPGSSLDAQAGDGDGDIAIETLSGRIRLDLGGR
ncbi:DUF4097 family beta strand repeat-containing protein [Coralloluteibacterium stylophorae]|uniref:DUF4097 family beta strand repeat protein n=1 Tax=Coralloluteibacterium stylophorae TaxID=1776034 RepID=A0A8J8AVY8_9GAMM|nr:DUF4097 family beta strand repeat-containing protein [Coralloluteibacterium stylophorae]MBS7457342.1 DUF4097 family beta strand repeat protein [Coralloluteibacterium stylophorae]